MSELQRRVEEKNAERTEYERRSAEAARIHTECESRIDAAVREFLTRAREVGQSGPWSFHQNLFMGTAWQMSLMADGSWKPGQNDWSQRLMPATFTDASDALKRADAVIGRLAELYAQMERSANAR